jgi:hypothetical protein
MDSVIDLQDANRKLFLSKDFCFLPYFLEVHLHNVLKDKKSQKKSKKKTLLKVIKKSQNKRNHGFS